jgi:hypothetical protein
VLLWLRLRLLRLCVGTGASALLLLLVLVLRVRMFMLVQHLSSTAGGSVALCLRTSRAADRHACAVLAVQLCWLLRRVVVTPMPRH